MTVSQIKDHQSESVKKLIDWLNENKITEVECIFPDIAGSSKGKILPVQRFIKSMEDQSLKLADSVFGQTVSGKWVYESEVIDYVEEDLIMKPDFSTIRRIQMAKITWIEPSADSPIYNGEFVLSSEKLDPESMRLVETLKKNVGGPPKSASIPLTEEEIRLLRGF